MRTLLSALAISAFLLPSFVLAAPGPVPYLQCLPQYQSVGLGEVAHFRVVGNVEGPFEWTTDDYALVDQGPYFDTAMTWPGRHQVDAVWGSQRATCYVDVGGSYAYAPNVYPVQNSGPGPNVTLSYVKLSAAPYTGYDIPAITIVLATVMLFAYALLLYKYGKRAFAAAIR